MSRYKIEKVVAVQYWIKDLDKDIYVAQFNQKEPATKYVKKMERENLEGDN